MPEKKRKSPEIPRNMCAGCGTPIPEGQKYCGGSCRQVLEDPSSLDESSPTRVPKRRPPGAS